MIVHVCRNAWNERSQKVETEVLTCFRKYILTCFHIASPQAVTQYQWSTCAGGTPSPSLQWSSPASASWPHSLSQPSLFGKKSYNSGDILKPD